MGWRLQPGPGDQTLAGSGSVATGHQRSTVSGDTGTTGTLSTRTTDWGHVRLGPALGPGQEAHPGVPHAGGSPDTAGGLHCLRQEPRWHNNYQGRYIYFLPCVDISRLDMTGLLHEGIFNVQDLLQPAIFGSLPWAYVMCN